METSLIIRLASMMEMMLAPSKAKRLAIVISLLPFAFFVLFSFMFVQVVCLFKHLHSVGIARNSVFARFHAIFAEADTVAAAVCPLHNISIHHHCPLIRQTFVLETLFISWSKLSLRLDDDVRFPFVHWRVRRAFHAPLLPIISFR